MQQCCFFFFFSDQATTEIYPLSLHDALPIWPAYQYFIPKNRDLFLGIKKHAYVRQRGATTQLVVVFRDPSTSPPACKRSHGGDPIEPRQAIAAAAPAPAAVPSIPASHVGLVTPHGVVSVQTEMDSLRAKVDAIQLSSVKSAQVTGLPPGEAQQTRTVQGSGNGKNEARGSASQQAIEIIRKIRPSAIDSKDHSTKLYAVLERIMEHQGLPPPIWIESKSGNIHVCQCTFSLPK